MNYISLVIQVIGDFRTIKEAHLDYKTAIKSAKQMQDKTHAEGYTDFKYIVEQYDIINPPVAMTE